MKKAVKEITSLLCTCMRCGHSWVARGKVAPKFCPGCKSAMWKTAKKAKKRGE